MSDAGISSVFSLLTLKFVLPDTTMVGASVQTGLGRICILKYGHSYLFDIFLGPSYNQSPPSVKYMTVSPASIFCRETRRYSYAVTDQRRKVSFQSELVR